MLQSLLAVLSGSLVGFTLGLIGGGCSIMATPLLLYVVGLQPPVAIGTGAAAVSVNAFANFAGHARAGSLRWRDAAIFAAIGMAGALIGSWFGKDFDGQRLVFLFALLMVAVGLVMLRRGGIKTSSALQPCPATPQAALPASRSARSASACCPASSGSGVAS